MKKSVIIGIIGLQSLMIAGTGFIGVQTYKMKQTAATTNSSLSSTINIMDDAYQQAEARKAEFGLISVGQDAATFALKNENGEEVKLDDYKGKKLLLVFGSKEDCNICPALYTSLDQFASQQSDIAVLIANDISPEQNKHYKQESGINIPIVTSSDKERGAYKVRMEPTSILIDEQGRIAGVHEHDSYRLDELIKFVDSTKQQANRIQSESNKG